MGLSGEKISRAAYRITCFLPISLARAPPQTLGPLQAISPPLPEKFYGPLLFPLRDPFSSVNASFPFPSHEEGPDPTPKLPAVLSSKTVSFFGFETSFHHNLMFPSCVPWAPCRSVLSSYGPPRNLDLENLFFFPLLPLFFSFQLSPADFFRGPPQM